MKEIAVSIVCNAFNQEKYIRDALDSFVSQKTSFAFEVLVHDDASTDKTAQIILEYEKKYPEIINPIYQTVNQYSKGISIGKNYQFPRAKGKYIAFCEGDDYYTSDEKLQKQFDILESKSDIDMCSHGTWEVQESTKKIISKTAPLQQSGFLSAEQVIKGGGGFLATNSLMMRRELIDIIPKFREFLMVDYSLQIQGALRGGIYYDNSFMSAHRVAANNSWTQSMKKNPSKRLKFNHTLEEMLNILNSETNNAYNDAIQERLKRIHADDYWYSGNFKGLLKSDNRELFKTLNSREKLLLFMHIFAPFLFN